MLLSLSFFQTVISTFKKRTSPQRAWKSDNSFEWRHTRLSESSRFGKRKRQPTVDSETLFKHVSQQNHLLLNLFALNFLRQQYSFDLCQSSLSTPSDSCIQEDSSYVAIHGVLPGTSTSIANTVAKSLIPNNISYQHCELLTVAGVNRSTDHLGRKTRNGCDEASSFTESIATSSNLRYQYFTKSVTSSSGNNRLNFAENDNIVQQKFKNRIWKPYSGQIYNGVKNWLTIGQTNALHQSSFSVAPFSHYEGGSVLGKSQINSRIPVLITRFPIAVISYCC